jgi:hypothetical protein
MAKTNSILEILNQFKSFLMQWKDTCSFVQFEIDVYTKKCMVWKLFDQKTAENIRTFI